jgi:hypothetical protein
VSRKAKAAARFADPPDFLEYLEPILVRNVINPVVTEEDKIE